MNNWHRLFAYLTAAIVLGLVVIILTQAFLSYVEDPTWVGLVALFCYGVAFLYVSFTLNKRFTQKRRFPSLFSYLLAGLLTLPTLLWIYLADDKLVNTRYLFTAVIVFSAGLGAYYGIKVGMKKREAYLEQNRPNDSEKNIPDGRNRPHNPPG